MTTSTKPSAQSGETVLSEADLDTVQGGQIELKNIQVTSYQLGVVENDASGDAVQIEEMTIAHETIKRPA